MVTQDQPDTLDLKDTPDTTDHKVGCSCYLPRRRWVSPSRCVCVYVPDDSVRNSSPIFTKFGTDHQDLDGTDEFVGGENRKSTTGFMRMRSKIPC